MKKNLRFLPTLGLAAIAATASAVQFTITENIGSLKGSGNYFALFDLTDGGSAPIASSSVTVTGLTLSGGVLGSTPTTDGSYEQTSNGFILTDIGGYGLAAVPVTVTSSSAVISFSISTTETEPFATDPDYFIYTLTDKQFNPVKTTGPLGEELVGVQLDSVDTTATAYSPLPGQMNLSGVETPVISAVPEPTSVGTFIIGVGSLLLRRKAGRRI